MNGMDTKPKVVFITNVFDQTQKDFYDAMFMALGDYFTLIIKFPNGYAPSSTRKINHASYALEYSSTIKECEKRIAEADALMLAQPTFDEYSQYFGSKVLIKVGEKFYKTPSNGFVEALKRYLSCYYHYGRYERFKPLYFGIGHYVSEDLKKYHLFKGRSYRFAYFSSIRSWIRESNLEYTSPIQLCWVGRLKKWKRPHLALEFCQQARMAGLDTRLTIYGDTSEEFDNLQRDIINLGLTNEVRLYVEPLHDKIYDELRAYHFCLATSDSSEGWGMTIEDAMSQGVPAIASRCSGASLELVKDHVNGFLFDTEEDFPALIEKLRNLTNMEYRELSRNCIKYIRDDFSVSFATERVIEIITEKMNGRVISFSDGLLGSIY